MCLEKTKIMDSVQNSHIYCNGPLSDTLIIRLSSLDINRTGGFAEIFLIVLRNVLFFTKGIRFFCNIIMNVCHVKILHSSYCQML